MSNTSKADAEEIKRSLATSARSMRNIASYASIHVKDKELVAKVEACEKGIKDTIQYIDDKLKG